MGTSQIFPKTCLDGFLFDFPIHQILIYHGFFQTMNLKSTGKGKGITITPHQAGHIIGGTIWLISKETDEILYAVNYNNIRDR